MIKVLVVGSKGFIGAKLLEHLRSSDSFDVYGADVLQDYEDPKYTVIDATDSNYFALFEGKFFDYCINCSGAANVSDSIKNPLRDYHLNTYNVFSLLEAIRKSGCKCKFITLSSAAVYGEPQYLPINEEHPTGPKSPYGIHKLHAEQLCDEYRSYFGVETCCLRIFSAYGPGLRKQLFWDVYQKTQKDSSDLQLWGTGNESRDFIFISDIVLLLESLLRRGKINYPILNVASGVEISIGEVVKEFVKILGLNTSIIRFSGEVRKGDPQNWRADVSKLREFGFEPKFSLFEGLNDYAKWLKEQK